MRTRCHARPAAWLLLTALLAAGGCRSADRPERVLERARLQTLPADDLGLISLRTVAECESPDGAYATEMRSAADGRALMRQRFPDGSWVWLETAPDGGSMRDSRSSSASPMDASMRTFLQAHEFHFAALAPDARHPNLQLEPGVPFAGQAADALLWTDELGGENRSYYRATDGLPLGLEFTNHLGGPPLVTVRFSDWPEEGEQRLFRTATITHGEQEFRFRFHTIEVNASLDSLFGPAPEPVSFPTEDGGMVHADLYGQGERGVVLAHGGRFTKESWATQAEVLTHAGFRVLAFDFRGRGESRGGPQAGSENDVHLDVLAAVRYLRQQGAQSVSVIGASFGGWAAARASVLADEGEIDRMVLLAASAIEQPERMKGRLLFVSARDDIRGEGDELRLPEIREQYERAPEPKQLLILEGAGHAQFLFDTGQGERLMGEILRFLTGS